MTPEQWQQVRESYEILVRATPEHQAVALAELSAVDAEVRVQVERLLSLSPQAQDFLEASPLLEADWHTQAIDPATAVGRRLGPYQIVREIGQGGMSTVYLAVRADDEYKKEVAVKVVWPGLSGNTLLRRFRQERQILAELDHPNIARLLDGGTTAEGWPYLVMEYVNGQPLTTYCDELRLSIADRLQLFCAVCAAVEYAHQKSVVHRDLKPNNILVTPDGTVKLLDFGIAKLLKPDPHATAATTVLHALTPDYASPEQIRGEDAQPSSDVYSLGVLLYELLTGVRPYQIKSPLPHEISRVICEVEPAPPSRRVIALARSRPRFQAAETEKLRRQLQGDLDNIVLTALAKDAAQRYSTPTTLVADIERHLTGRPVLARGATPLYRLGKYIRRHKMATTLLLVALVAASVATVWQFRARQLRAEETLRSAYVDTLHQATAAWLRGQPREAQELLQRIAPRAGNPWRGGFEWNYLWRQTGLQPLTLPHAWPPAGVDFFPDQQRIFTVDPTYNVLSLWDTAAERLIVERADVAPSIWGQVHFVNGEMLLAKWERRSLQVRDAVTGRLVATCTDPTTSFQIAPFYLDAPERLLTLHEDGSLKVWDWRLCRARLLGKVPAGPYLDWRLATDRQHVLLYEGSTRLSLWDLTKWRRLTVLSEKQPYSAYYFSEDGRLFFTLFGTQTVKVYEAATGRLLATITEPDPIESAALSPDHRHLVTCHNSGWVKVWDALTGRLRFAYQGHERAASVVAFSNGGQQLATTGKDGKLRLWDLERECPLTLTHAHVGGATAVRAARNNQLLATCGSSDNTAKVWRIADLLEDAALSHHTDRVFSVAFSPDGKTLAAASGDKTISLWDVATRRLLRVFTGHTGLVLCVNFMPDGRRLISSGEDGTARVWDVTTGQSLLTLKHSLQVHFVANSPDGKLLATACDDHNIRLWDAATGTLLAELRGHTDNVWAVSFSPDGRLLASGSNDLVVKLWDVVTRREVATLRGHTDWVWSTVFSPDGKYLATGSMDRTAILWDVKTRQQIRQFTGHTDEVFEVAFSPDGKRLATASNDNTIKLWETETGTELLTLKDHADQVWSVAFSPDGQTLASASWDKTIRLWRAAKAEEMKVESAAK